MQSIEIETRHLKFLFLANRKRCITLPKGGGGWIRTHGRCIAPSTGPQPAALSQARPRPLSLYAGGGYLPPPRKHCSTRVRVVQATINMKEKEKDRKNRGAEKPVSLWGASFRDVLGALLKTRPKPKAKSRGDERHD